LPAGITRSRLLREDEVIAVRAGHPLTRGKVSRERLVEFPHVVVDPGGTEEKEADGFIDGDYEKMRGDWRLALRLPVLLNGFIWSF